MKLKVMKFLYLFLLFFLLTGCKNDQLENAIRGTYYNNNYKLEISIGVGDFIGKSGGIQKKSFNEAKLYKWEEEHKTFFKIEGPGYYEISGGRWEIENENLKLTFYDKDVDSKYWDFTIIPINFIHYANNDLQNMHSCFILRGREQNFFPESISQGYHSD
jgi:hypothetical protein